LTPGKVRQLTWRQKWPEKSKTINRASYWKNRVKRLKERQLYRENNRKKVRECQKASRRKLKLKVIEAYGGKCSCCNEDRLDFLTIEHTNHDGKAHRAAIGAGSQMYRDLVKRGFPKDGFTVYCWNCQMATRYGDICPHKLMSFTNQCSSSTEIGKLLM
jgi:hypothetical protein